MAQATGPGLTFISAIAVQAEIAELLPQFEQQRGIAVQVTYDVNPAVAKRITDGETFDVGLTNPWYVDEMISLGLVWPDIHVPFGRVPLTIGAATVAPNGVASSHDAMRKLLLGADSIAYSSIGTSGKTFLRAIEMLGLQEELRGRLRPMGAGEPPLAVAVANGDVQYAIAPLSRIMAAPGVTPVANFPSELGLDIDMSLFVHRQGHRDTALPLVQFLSDPGLDAYLKSHGVYRYKF